MTKKSTSESRPAAPAKASPPTDPQDRAPIYETRWYWMTILLSTSVLVVSRSVAADYLPAWANSLRLGAVVLSTIVIVFTLVALGRRGRVVHRGARATKRIASGIAEGVRARGEKAEGSLGQFFARLVRSIKWLILLPVRIVVWAWYTAEKLFWRILLILYDVVYYPLYAAWSIAHFALRTALRLVAFALRVVWRIVGVPTRIWPVRRWWRTKKMPEIMGQWNAVVRHRQHLRATRIDRLRRLAALRGEDPDRWQADYELRHAFPLPHPEKARVAIRKRVAFILEVQKARREGRPMPRHHREDEEPRGLARFRREKKDAGPKDATAPQAKATAPTPKA